jgi:DNA invertase Pin-like site-specific DNA recombinase
MTQRRAALYVRVAAEPDPTFNGLERQRGLLIEYAEMHDCDIVAIYEDIGSGLREDRPGLQHLMADAAAGLMDVVLMRDPSRLFRDRTLFWQYYPRLQNDYGVGVVFVACETRMKGGEA